MEYGEFKEKIRKAMEEIYGEMADVEIREVLKVNGRRHSAVCIRLKRGGSETAPIIYLEELFRRYSEGEIDLYGCIKIITQLERDGYRLMTEQFSGRILEWELVCEKIYPVLLSTEKNKELLSGLVSEKLLDLSIIYIIRHITEDGDGCSVKINDGLMELYGVSKAQLYAQAMHNLEMDGYHFCEMSGYMRQALCGGKDNFPARFGRHRPGRAG